MSWGSISAASHHRRHGPASADALRARRFTRECPWSFRDEATSRPLRGLGTSGGSRLGPLPASYPASRARVHSRDRTEPIREVSKGKSDKIRTFAEGALMSQGSRDRALASATPHSTASARLPSPTDFPEHLLGTVAWLEGREARIGYVSRHFGGHPLTSSCWPSKPRRGRGMLDASAGELPVLSTFSGETESLCSLPAHLDRRRATEVSVRMS
jgi:hypothetical protein